MPTTEQLELNAHREQLTTDVSDLVETYRSMFEWDVPEIDQEPSDQLILAAVREALDGVEADLHRPAR